MRGHKMATRPSNSPKSYSLPSHLYMKRGVFYYRSRISKHFAGEKTRCEIRVSLRTGFLKQAQAMAKKIHEQLSKYKNQFQNTDQICTYIKNYVDELLNETNKCTIEDKNIRLRLNGYLKYMLDKAAMEQNPLPEVSYIAPDGHEEPIAIDKIFDEEANKLINEINTLDNYENWFNSNIIELVSENIFDRNEITKDNAMSLAKSFHRIKSILNKIQASRIRGDYSFEQIYYSSKSEEYPRTVKNINDIKHYENENKNINQYTLSKLIQKYITTQIKDKVWKEHSQSDHRNRLENIIDILGDKYANSVSREDMRYVRDALSKLPPSRKKNKEYKTKTIEELLSINYPKTLSIKTINTIIESISSMYEWAIREGLLTVNPAKGLTIKDTQLDIEKRIPLSNDDIHKIFFSSDYKPSTFSKPAYYWCPLIGLYSGIRLEEICQLHCEDIYCDEDGIWIFDIHSDSTDGLNDKILKNKNAKRKIPIHDRLKDLGLLKYVEKQKEMEYKRLFPELNKTKRSPKYGK